MTLNEFINQFDKVGAVVLLEGKREIPEADSEKLFKLGKLLAARTENMLFLSGNAGGADQLFSEGVAMVDKTRLQVITPYTGHRKKTNVTYQTISLEQISLGDEPGVIYYSKLHKNAEKSIDPYISGNINRNTIKAAYIIRDTIKVIGTKTIKPASFGIFYDDLQSSMAGGTGHTMKVCKLNRIPIIDQRIWFRWLKE